MPCLCSPLKNTPIIVIHRSGAVQDDQRQVRIRQCLKRPAHANAFNAIAGLAHARGIRKPEGNAIHTDGFCKNISGRAGNLGHDGPVP